jgi:integrase
LLHSVSFFARSHSGHIFIFAYPALTRRIFMRAKLTPQLIAGAKADPRTDRTIIWDATLPSFGLQVTTRGAKSFVVQYRARKRSRRLSIKATLSLSEARKEAKAILGSVAKGHDPLSERRSAEAAATNTLQSVCESYFAREGKKLRTVKGRQAALARLVYPKLGRQQIEDIRRSDVVRLLDHIEDTSGVAMADQTLAYLRRVLTWHAARSDDFLSPIVRGMARTKPSELARDRVLNDDEIRNIWAAAGKMNNAHAPLIRFILLTATRKHEAAHMRRDEIDGDIWTIPARRYKGKRDHVVPLSRAAQKIIAALPIIGDGKLVFTHDGEHYIGGFSQFKEKLDKASGVTGWRLHDLRRTARSLMSRAGVNGDVAERCLGHAVAGVRGTYDRYQYLDEKRRAFEALAQQIERILDLQENVVPLRAAP